MTKIIDKKNIIKNIKSSDSLVIDLGCGSRKRNPQSVGIDILDYPEVDIVGDVVCVLQQFPDSCVSAVFAHHFIEHLIELDTLMNELERVVKVDGVIDFVAPHFSNPYFYSDPTHRAFFGLYTFCYLTDNSMFSRSVPTYQNKSTFIIERVELIFKSTRPFYFRHIIKRFVGAIFNSCNYLKEFYEENISSIFPCYEVRYILRKKK